MAKHTSKMFSMFDNSSGLCEKELTIQTDFLHFQPTLQVRSVLRLPAVFPSTDRKTVIIVFS